MDSSCYPLALPRPSGGVFVAPRRLTPATHHLRGHRYAKRLDRPAHPRSHGKLYYVPAKRLLFLAERHTTRIDSRCGPECDRACGFTPSERTSGGGLPTPRSRHAGPFWNPFDHRDDIPQDKELRPVLVADVTLVGATPQKEGTKPKKTPNPNVLLELGYGAAILGSQRIILLLNKHYGSPESLPFDLKFRRFPFTYTLGPNSDRRQDAIDYLVEGLEGAISACLAAEHVYAEEVISRLPAYTRLLVHKHHLDEMFSESESDNKVISRLDMAIAQLLELGIIQCVKAGTASGLSYAWTYLGKRCIAQMGLPTHHLNFGGLESRTIRCSCIFMGMNLLEKTKTEVHQLYAHHCPTLLPASRTPGPAYNAVQLINPACRRSFRLFSNFSSLRLIRLVTGAPS